MVYACRSGPLWLKLVILALAALLAMASISTGNEPQIQPSRPTDTQTLPNLERLGDVQQRTAIESTRAMVRRELARGTIVVALGTEMDLTEHRVLMQKLKAPACMGIDDSVRDELLALRGSLKAELARHLGMEANRILAGLTEEKLHDALMRAVKLEVPSTFRWEEFAVEVGFTTYHYWMVTITPPDAEERALLLDRRERLVVLPCTKQAYLRLTLRDPPRMGP
jgi:hypothetical protein